MLELVLLPQEGDEPIVHQLHTFDLRDADAAFVRDVDRPMCIALAVFSVDATNAETKVLGDILDAAALLELRQHHVNASPHGRPDVGRAGPQVAPVGIAGEVELRPQGVNEPGEPVEDAQKVGAHFHGHDPHHVLLVDPDDGVLGFVHEDAPSLRPVVGSASNGQVGVFGHVLEQEVSVDELGLTLCGHLCETLVLASQIPLEGLQGVVNGLFSLEALAPGDARGESKPLQVASTADSRAQDPAILELRKPFELPHFQVGLVDLLGWIVAMVKLDDGVEEPRKNLVALRIRRIAPDRRIGIRRATADDVEEREARRSLLVAKRFHHGGQNLRHERLVSGHENLVVGVM